MHSYGEYKGGHEPMDYYRPLSRRCDNFCYNYRDLPELGIHVKPDLMWVGGNPVGLDCEHHGFPGAGGAASKVGAAQMWPGLTKAARLWTVSGCSKYGQPPTVYSGALTCAVPFSGARPAGT